MVDESVVAPKQRAANNVVNGLLEYLQSHNIETGLSGARRTIAASQLLRFAGLVSNRAVLPRRMADNSKFLHSALSFSLNDPLFAITGFPGFADVLRQVVDAKYGADIDMLQSVAGLNSAMSNPERPDVKPSPLQPTIKAPRAIVTKPPKLEPVATAESSAPPLVSAPAKTNLADYFYFYHSDETREQKRKLDNISVTTIERLAGLLIVSEGPATKSDRQQLKSTLSEWLDGFDKASPPLRTSLLDSNLSTRILALPLEPMLEPDKKTAPIKPDDIVSVIAAKYKHAAAALTRIRDEQGRDVTIEDIRGRLPSSYSQAPSQFQNHMADLAVAAHPFDPATGGLLLPAKLLASALEPNKPLHEFFADRYSELRRVYISRYSELEFKRLMWEYSHNTLADKKNGSRVMTVEQLATRLGPRFRGNKPGPVNAVVLARMKGILDLFAGAGELMERAQNSSIQLRPSKAVIQAMDLFQIPLADVTAAVPALGNLLYSYTLPPALASAMKFSKAYTLDDVQRLHRALLPREVKKAITDFFHRTEPDALRANPVLQNALAKALNVPPERLLGPIREDIKAPELATPESKPAPKSPKLPPNRAVLTIRTKI